MSKFLYNEDLRYFLLHSFLGQVIFEYVLCPIYFLILLTSFIDIKNFFIATYHH